MEIVRGDFAGDFANIFLHLMDDVDLLRLEPLRRPTGPCFARKNRRVYACYCYQFFSRDYRRAFPLGCFHRRCYRLRHRTLRRPVPLTLPRGSGVNSYPQFLTTASNRYQMF